MCAYVIPVYVTFKTAGDVPRELHREFHFSHMSSARANIHKAKLDGKNTLRYVTFNPAGIHNESVLYHKTRILVCTYDNQLQRRPLLFVTIDTGGFNTVTTRDRLNRFLPSGWHVFTDSGVMFVRTPSGTFPNVDGARYDGATGLPCEPDLHKDSTAETLILKRKIDKFCRALESNPFPTPSAGDPWCNMFPDGWNPRTMNRETLLDWLDSCYINGSFVAAAMRRKGWTDTALAMAHDRPRDFMPQIKRACRDYFKAGLGLA